MRREVVGKTEIGLLFASVGELRMIQQNLSSIDSDLSFGGYPVSLYIEGLKKPAQVVRLLGEFVRPLSCYNRIANCIEIMGHLSMWQLVVV